MQDIEFKRKNLRQIYISIKLDQQVFGEMRKNWKYKKMQRNRSYDATE